jgi:hypothetical protein
MGVDNSGSANAPAGSKFLLLTSLEKKWGSDTNERVSIPDTSGLM